MKNRKKIGIIGGSGFIGTYLCDSLLRDGSFEVEIFDKDLGFDNPACTTVGDVRDPKALDQFAAGSEILINLAAEHRDDVTPYTLYYDVNVLGAKNIVQAAIKNNTKVIVFTSSVAVYGRSENELFESHPISPENHYGKSKAEAEMIFMDWLSGAPRERSLVIIRPTVVFGPRNRGNVYNLMKQVTSRYFVSVGSGLNKKSVAYVENLVEFIRFSSGFGPGLHVYNYVDKPDMSMSQLIRAVLGALGRDERYLRIPFWFGLLIGYAFDLVSSVSRRRLPISSLRVRKFCSTSLFGTSVAETGFTPPVDLETALAKTVVAEFIAPGDSRLFYSE